LSGQAATLPPALHARLGILDPPRRGLVTLLTLWQIRRGAFPSIKAQETTIRRYIKATDADPRPFVWTKSVDDFLDGVRRFCLRTTAAAKCQATSNSAHQPPSDTGMGYVHFGIGSRATASDSV